MSFNSIADQIVGKIQTVLEGLESISTVTRKPPDQAEFEELAGPQFPLAILVGGLPVAESFPANKTNFKSLLPVSIIVVISDNVNPGQAIYNVADDIWAALMNLPRDDRNAYLDGLALDITVVPGDAFDIDPPYVAFRYDLEVSYIHTNRSL